ncbi:MAG: sulfatase-like hydrolase/transferase, partial [Pirellulales bacterium]|nr:sulfatase-like hydrolase/transferase [Pirellulales bacterium]
LMPTDATPHAGGRAETRGECRSLASVAGGVLCGAVIAVPGVAYVVALFQVVLWFHVGPPFRFMAAWSPAARVGSLAVELLTTLLVFYLAQAVSVGRRCRGAALRYAVAAVYAALLFFRLNAGTSLDFYLLTENWSILFYRESLAMLITRVGLDHWLVGLNGALLMIAVDLLHGVDNRAVGPRRGWLSAAIVFGVLLLIVVSPAYYCNDLTYAARTATECCLGQFVHPDCDDAPGYPYVQPAPPAGPARETPVERPHVFLIMMESFNANFVRAKTDSGKEVTPVFNALVDEGVFVERFYGNSVQTCRGQLAALCSILPSTQEKVFTDHPELRVKSLAHILRAAGYRTSFFKAYRTLKFDNTGRFMRHLGFDEAHAMDRTFVSEVDRPFTWGWGLQDDKFYQKVFRHLDKSAAAGTTEPRFVCLHTVSHHVPFCKMPPELRYLYPEPANRRQRFANSMFLADKYLAEFFTQLRSRPEYANSIVIVTGDHGFPAGEHDSFYNERGFWEENFRTPLLILWPGHLEARTIGEGTYSQIDIAPTILELAGISASNHFTGRSILSDRGDRPIHLIQPYNGAYRCVVRFPLKYVHGRRGGDEYLFDLDKDPGERRNLIEEYRGSRELESLRGEIGYIDRNQLLIDRNRIWPRHGDMDDAVVVKRGDARPVLARGTREGASP